MIQIIDKRSSGKTSRLMLLAKEHNATFVCANPRAMKEKAKWYGLDGINFISYHDFVTSYDENTYVIDEVESFLQSIMGDSKLIGYSLTVDD
jgi:hypothetical protein